VDTANWPNEGFILTSIPPFPILDHVRSLWQYIFLLLLLHFILPRCWSYQNKQPSCLLQSLKDTRAETTTSTSSAPDRPVTLPVQHPGKVSKA